MRPEAFHDPHAPRPIGYFVHHQGSGHARRCAAIVAHLAPHPVVVFCAKPELLPAMGSHVDVVPIPDFHAQPSRSQALHAAPLTAGLDCAPVGVSAIRCAMATIAHWLGEADPALLITDVSAEVTLLARILSVPTVKIRMHGRRDDQAHTSAYSSCVGFIAPFDERLEQADWPQHFRARTCYTGGLIDTVRPVPDRAAARARLGLDPARRIIVASSGGGGVGVSIASLSMASRALPDALWLSVGRSARNGHETDFANLQEVGWVDDLAPYLAAADVVVGSAGDTLVHEVARVGRPLICVPEWCYYGEQAAKAREFARLGAAVCCPTWPASFEEWREAIRAADTLDLTLQRSLVGLDAAERAARYLRDLVDGLWQGALPDAIQCPLNANISSRDESRSPDAEIEQAGSVR